MNTQFALNRASGLFTRAIHTVCFVLLGFFAHLSAFAASQTWSNAPTTSAWNLGSNWIANAVPGTTNLTGNTVNGDVATFNSPIPLSGIGNEANPVLTDDATLVAVRSRQISGITFDTANCGAYVISNASPAALPTAGAPETGILNVSHNGSIQINAAVTNKQRIVVPVYTRLPSSTDGIYNLVNNATDPNATLYIVGMTNDSANTRGTDFRLAGSNTGTNTIGGLSAGTTTTGANRFTKNGDGTWILTGPNDFRGQTIVRITAGRLIVRDVAAFNGPAAATVTNTGVLQIDGVTLNQPSLNLHIGGTIRMNGTASLNGVAVGNHTATSVTLGTINASDVFTVGTALAAASLVTGGAADSVLNTAGPGTLVFAQANTYIGRWSFGAATNQISNASALGTGPNANVAPGATLDLTPLGATSFVPTTTGFGGSGTGSAVGSTAAAVKADPAGTLDLSGKVVNLTFTPSSTSGDTTRPALYIAQGTLALSGNTFFVNNAASPLGVGTYRLIQQASGSITSGGGYAAIVSGNGLTAGATAEIQVTGGDVNLIVSIYVPKNLVWTGGNPNTTWDLNTTPNFLNGAVPSVFKNSDTVTFNSIGSTNSTVTLAGTLAPATVTVDTSANDYTFSGTGQIGGSGSFTKISSGTLSLQTANTYAGGTVISNGVVRYGVANALSSTGTGDVGVFGGGTIDLNNFDGALNGLNGNGAVDNAGASASVLSVGNNDRGGTFSGVLKNTVGSLALTKVGTNTQVLSGSNSFSGPTTITLGTLAAANDHALGIGDLTINAGTLDVRSSLLYLNSLAGGGGVIGNNTTTTTNRIIITGATTTTFGGSIGNGSGGGGIALTVLGGSLTLSAPNTYTGGTIVGSGASFSIANGPASATGGLIASNGATLGLSGGSTTPSPTPSPITTVDGATVSFTAGALGKIWASQFVGSPTTTNRILNPMSFGGDTSFKDFLGVVSLEAAGSARFINIPGGAAGGGDNTTFDFIGATAVLTRDPATVRLGHIRGGSSISGIDTATGGGTDTFILGAKGVDSTFHGFVRGLNNIVKDGAGRLTFDGIGGTTNTDNATFTNYVYAGLITYTLATTISNGVLALVVPNDLSNSPSITLASSSAVLDASQMGIVSNFTDVNGDNSALVTNGILTLYSGQTLGGLGTVRGAVVAQASSTVAPGLSAGILTITNSATLNGSVNMELDRNSSPKADRLVAPSINVNGATINVTNIGPDLVTGDVYQLFSVPVTGTPAAVNLPAQNQAATITYVWNNKLAIDGTIVVSSGANAPNPNPTNITSTVSGNQLTLSWPASHLGWDLQTNSVGIAAANAWFTYPGSFNTNQIIVTIDPSRTNVFYRLHVTP